MIRTLIVDEQRSIRNALREKLQYEGYQVEVAENLSIALKIQEESNELFELIISDDKAFNQYIAEYGSIPKTYNVIVIAETRSIEDAIQFIRAGAINYLSKPLNMNLLLETIRDVLEERNNSNAQSGPTPATNTIRPVKKKKADCSDNDNMEYIVGSSSSIEYVKNMIRKVAPSEARVLIMGANGTGKELVAKALHNMSCRAKAPFIEVNCAAIPSELIESELFEHEKGAFTSAIKQRKGKFELASGGTLFLDEIGDMSLAAQAKVLRVLQEGNVSRVGGDKSLDVDVRVLAATNKDLKEEIKKGSFREDLYHRLSVIVISVPPLVERIDDIPLLVEHFINAISEDYGVDPKAIDNAAIDKLKKLKWSGNVRELRNVMERLIVLCDDVITSDDINKFVSA